MNIAFVTYETRFAPSGGIAAVMNHLPSAVMRATGLRTIVVSPFHWRIAQTVCLDLEPHARAQVHFLGTDLDVEIGRHVDEAGVEWFFLRPDDGPLFAKAEERFFAGYPHPYRTPEPVLVRDAILFGACVSQSLPAIDPRAVWTVLMQDWEAAAAALAMAPSTGDAFRRFLTLHNSYDSGGVDPQMLRDVGIDPSACPAIRPSNSPTVLERALRCIQPPIFTVSEEFARELTDDVLQATVMAPHLSDALGPRLVGVDNGPFVKPTVDREALVSAKAGQYHRIAYWKHRRRGAFLKALNAHVSTDQQPIWGDPRQFSELAATGQPWFVFAGRDDPRQRGHDVAALAIERFLGDGGAAQFLFLPIPSDEGLRGLSFVDKLAERWPDRVLALPFIFREGYFAALQGATYGVMPSLYEPFGGANEFYLHGTVGIARATGGLVEQIVPLRAAASHSHAVQNRAQRWHSLSARPTGILYREPDIISAAPHWQQLNEGGYDASGQTPGNDRVEHRRRNPLFRAMARELRLAIEDGARVWRESPGLYWEMLVEGFEYVQRTFSWDKAAQEYVRTCGLDPIGSAADREPERTA